MLTAVLQALKRVCERLSRAPDPIPGRIPTAGDGAALRNALITLFQHPNPSPILVRARDLSAVGLTPETALGIALAGAT